MDISADKGKTNGTRTDSYSAGIHFGLGIFSRLIGIFTLTESDRMKAGIHIRRQGV